MTRWHVSLLAVLALLGAGTPLHGSGPSTQEGSCATEAYRRLDFWVGDWEVRSGDRRVGDNRIEKVLGGCALLEHWRSADGGRGKSLFYYAPAENVWKQVWVTSAPTRPGGVKEKVLLDSYDGPGVRFQGRIRLPDGGSYLDRTTLVPRDGGRVRQVVETSSDGGDSWETRFDALYLPVRKGASGGRGRTERDARPGTDTVLAVNGTELFVRRVGGGEPLMVVHGGPVLDHGYLVEPLRPLGDDFELVFYDQRLSGRSAGTVDSASVTLGNFVADIESIRSELGLGRVHLLGHSWGGLLAALYALEHPDRLRSLVLVSPMAPSAELWQREEKAARGRTAPDDTAGMGALRSSEAFRAGEPAAIERMLRMSFRGQFADPSDASSLDFHIGEDYRQRSRQFGYLMSELSSYDLTDRLPRLEVPTLLVYGDVEVGADVGADTLRSLLPRASMEVIPGAGHFSFVERPEAFLRLVRDFLGRGERGS